MESAKYAVPLFLAGWGWTLAQSLMNFGSNGLGRGFESVSVAKSLALTGQFRDPFDYPTGLTAHLAPVYPSIMALAIRVWGLSGSMVLILLNALLLGVSAAALPWLSIRLYNRPEPGVGAACLLLMGSRVSIQCEAFCSSLLLIAVAAAILKKSPFVSGTAAGIAILTNPVSLIALAPLAISKGKRFGAIVLGLALLVCSPWIWRNYVSIGAPYFVRDNLGLELFISNNDLAGPELVSNHALPELHPTANRAQAALLAQIGEGAYNRVRFRDAMIWMQAHPAGFLRLSAERILFYWLPPLREGWQAYGYWLITILAFSGAWFGRKYPAAVALAIASVAYSLPYAVIQVDVRYRYPTLWIQALLAGYGATVIARRAIQKWGELRP